MSRKRRQGMVEADHPRLSITRQSQVLGLARSTWYHRPQGEKAVNLDLMRLIDAQFLETPFYGSRQMQRHLKNQGVVVGRTRVRRLMRKMGLMAIYQKPRTSVPHPEHRIYPYLLRGLRIDHPDQVWCADITYVPMKRGFLYLVAIMDWYSRAVLSWRLSNTMDATFCVDALEEAMNRYGVPGIFNTDQGSQFTGLEFTQTLKEAGASISMDGKGRWMDNVFIERLWRSVKWECIYLRELETGSQAREALDDWFRFYNEQRPHTAFDGRRPMEVYRDGQRAPKAA